MHKNQSQRPISYQHNVKKLNKKKKIKDKQKKLKNQKNKKTKLSLCKSIAQALKEHNKTPTPFIFII